MGGKLELTRDVIAYTFVGIMFLVVFMPNLDDEQWIKGFGHIAPVYFLIMFSLCGLFYYRSIYFNILCRCGNDFPTYQRKSDVRKRATIVYCLSWFMFLLFFSSFVAMVIIPSEDVDYAENDDGTIDYSMIIYASPIVVDCDYNEECVSIKSLEESYLFSFLAPDDMVFENGNPDDYYEVSLMLFIPLLIGIFWFTTLFWFWLYGYIKYAKDIENATLSKFNIGGFLVDGVWDQYYEKKSYRSYGAFLLSLAFSIPALLFIDPSSLNPLTVNTLFSCITLLFCICLYFKLYEINIVLLMVSHRLLFRPTITILISSSIVFFYSSFTAPVVFVNDIWLSDWIFKWGEYGVFNSSSYRLSLANLLLNGTLGSVVLGGTTVYLTERNNAQFNTFYESLLILATGVGTFLMALAVLLGVYGYIAMIFVQTTSLDFNYLSPLLIIITSLLILRHRNIIAEITSDSWDNLGNNKYNQTNKIKNKKQNNIPSLRSQSSNPQVVKKIPKYTSGTGYGVHVTIPNHLQHKTAMKDILLAPSNPRSGWDDLPSLWPAFTKKELMQILKLFHLDSKGNKPILIERCAIHFRNLHIRDVLSTGANLYNPINLTEILDHTPETTPPTYADSKGDNSNSIKTQLLDKNESNKPIKIEHTTTLDSNGVTTITTELSIVTINKIQQTVEKIPLASEYNQIILNEINIMKSLDNKGIEVGLLGYEIGDKPQILIRYFGSHKLGEGIESINLKGKINIISDLVKHVGAIQKVGWVHRDLKPDNILIDFRPNGEHRFCAIIDYGIAMKINRKQSETYNTAGTPFFGHSTQKDKHFNASTGQDWFSLARIFALILRRTTVKSLNAEIEMSQTGLNMYKEIKALGFNDEVVDLVTDLILQSTKPRCEQHENITILARIGKEIITNF